MRIDWSTLPEGINSLADMIEAGRARREQEEEIRRLLQQQAQEAAQLRASGTVPDSFGSLLESFRPPPPALPPATGIMGTLGEVFGDIGRGRRRGPPADLLTEETQQRTLQNIFQEMGREQRETEREQRQAHRDVEMEKRRAATQENITARQQAGFTEAEKRQQAGFTEAEKRQQTGFTEAEKRQQVGLAATEKREESRMAKKEVDDILVKFGVEMTRAQMNRVNRLIAAHPEWGYGRGFRWEEGTGLFSGKGHAIPLEENERPTGEESAPVSKAGQRRLRWNPDTQDFE